MLFLRRRFALLLAFPGVDVLKMYRRRPSLLPRDLPLHRDLSPLLGVEAVALRAGMGRHVDSKVRAKRLQEPACPLRLLPDEYYGAEAREQREQVAKLLHPEPNFRGVVFDRRVPAGDHVPEHDALALDASRVHEVEHVLRGRIVVVPADKAGARLVPRRGGHWARLFEQEQHVRVDATIERVELRELPIRMLRAQRANVQRQWCDVWLGQHRPTERYRFREAKGARGVGRVHQAPVRAPLA